MHLHLVRRNLLVRQLLPREGRKSIKPKDNATRSSVDIMGASAEALRTMIQPVCVFHTSPRVFVSVIHSLSTSLTPF